MGIFCLTFFDLYTNPLRYVVLNQFTTYNTIQYYTKINFYNIHSFYYVSVSSSGLPTNNSNSKIILLPVLKRTFLEIIPNVKHLKYSVFLNSLLLGCVSQFTLVWMKNKIKFVWICDRFQAKDNKILSMHLRISLSVRLRIGIKTN